MSYILDALKKSDRERPRGAPALPLHEVPAFRLRPRRTRKLMLAGGIALFVLCAAAAGVWMDRTAGDAQTSVVEATVPAMPIVVEQAPDAPPASSAASLEEDGGTAAPADPVVTGNGSEPQTAAPPASVSREGLLELWQLTEAEQKYLQGLDVSFHVHSNDPAKRAVIINGLRAREGQSLGEDLRLAEIVPDGIVLEFQGQFVHLANPQPY